MDLDDVAQLALALPGVRETDKYRGWRNWEVAGKAFAWERPLRRADLEALGADAPTGEILANAKGSVNDFWSKPKQLGASFDDPEIEDNCGLGCIGYDNCWTVNRGQLGNYDWRTHSPVATVSSAWSGIRLDIYTDQDAFQVYGCGGQNGTLTLKKSQGIFDDADFPRTIPQYGCVVLEVQDYIDGINHPEWMRGPKQIFRPGGDPYVLQARYSFSIDTDDEEPKHDEL
jgi:aldose 1-epimerase